MITINLLPKNLQRTERKITFAYKGYLVWAFVSLVSVHALLFSVALGTKVETLFLRGRLAKMAPASRDSSSRKAEIKELENKVSVLQKVLGRRVSMTDLFSALVAAVPRGLWLEHFNFSDDGLVVQGTVVSKSGDEMTLIGKFLQDLKSSSAFATVFSRIELNSVQRRTIKMYDVVDFVLVGAYKR